MHSKFVMLAALAAMTAACGSSSSTKSSFNGTIHGQNFTLADVVSTTGMVMTNSGALNLGVTVMTSAGGYCGTIGAAHENRNTQYFNIFLGVTDANVTPSPPSAAGAYPIVSQLPANAKFAVINFVSIDANCQIVDAQGAVSQSGMVNLTGISNGAYTGNFDVTLDSNDHITGTFKAASCPALGDAITQGTTVTCID